MARNIMFDTVHCPAYESLYVTFFICMYSRTDNFCQFKSNVRMRGYADLCLQLYLHRVTTDLISSLDFDKCISEQNMSFLVIIEKNFSPLSAKNQNALQNSTLADCDILTILLARISGSMRYWPPVHTELIRLPWL